MRYDPHPDFLTVRSRYDDYARLRHTSLRNTGRSVWTFAGDKGISPSDLREYFSRKGVIKAYNTAKNSEGPGTKVIAKKRKMDISLIGALHQTAATRYCSTRSALISGEVNRRSYT
jgi:hypothetical protein